MDFKKAFFFLLLSSEAFANDCIENKYIFDFGSGSLKAAGYVVNSCNNTIEEHLPKYNKVLDIQKCILQSKNGKTLSRECITKSIAAVNEIKKLYNTDCFNNECIGFATAWARNISNSGSVFSLLFQQTKIDFSIVSQEKEGILVLEAAKMHLPSTHINDETIIFDSGGGSFQLSGFNKQEQHFVFQGKYGSATMLHELNNIFNKGNKYELISKKDIKKALEYVNKIVATDITHDRNLTSLITKKDLKVYSLSGFVQYGIKHNLRFTEDTITISDLEKMIEESATNSFAQMKKKYPNYLIDNQAGLLLVYAIMKALRVDKFMHISKDTKDYLALNPGSVIN